MNSISNVGLLSAGLLLSFVASAQSQVAQSVVNGTLACISVASCEKADRCIRNIIYPTFKINGDGSGYALPGSDGPRLIRQFDDTTVANEFLATENAGQEFWLVVVPASVVAAEDGSIRKDFHLYSVSQNALTDLKGLSSEFMKISCKVVSDAGNN